MLSFLGQAMTYLHPPMKRMMRRLKLHELSYIHRTFIPFKFHLPFIPFPLTSLPRAKNLNFRPLNFRSLSGRQTTFQYKIPKIASFYFAPPPF